MTSSKDQLEIILRQYSECWMDLRDHRSRIWQIPTSMVIVTYAFVGLVLPRLERMFQTGFAVAAALIVFVFYVQLRKERFFEMYRTSLLEKMQETLKKKGGERIEWRTDKVRNHVDCEHLNVRWGWFEMRRAYRWLHLTMVLTVSGLLVLAFLILLNVAPIFGMA